MSAYLWLDSEADKAINLGDPLTLLATFNELEKIVGDSYDQYADLFGVPDATMGGEDVDSEWLAVVLQQANDVKAKYADRLTPAVSAVLDDLLADEEAQELEKDEAEAKTE